MTFFINNVSENLSIHSLSFELFKLIYGINCYFISFWMHCDMPKCYNFNKVSHIFFADFLWKDRHTCISNMSRSHEYCHGLQVHVEQNLFDGHSRRRDRCQGNDNDGESAVSHKYMPREFCILYNKIYFQNYLCNFNN